nr:hypothetical protein [Candidatus Sigynarchaeota archaeon]
MYMKPSVISNVIFTMALATAFAIAMINPYVQLMRTSGLVEKRVAAFYYPWYSNDTNYTRSVPCTIVDTGAWRHWNGSTLNTPFPGSYDSADPALIEQHLREAEWAGIDALVVSYWGAGGYGFTNFKNMLNVANLINSNLSFTLYFEIFMNNMENKTEDEAAAFISNEFLMIYQTFTSTQYKDLIWHEQGKPVLFVYVVQAVTAGTWDKVMANITGSNVSFFTVADRPGSSPSYNKHFQGTHQYDVYYPTYHDDYINTYLDLKHNAQRFGQIFCAGVAPGYDDHMVRPGNLPLPRDGNQTYQRSWSVAVSLNPDWITITSWNEWHEGTEIEPSVENGDKALNQTRAYVAEFKSGHYQQLQVMDIYSSLYSVEIGNAIWAAIITIGVFVTLLLVPWAPKSSRLYGLRIVVALLLMCVAWAGFGFFIAWEIMLGKTFEIIGDWYIFLAPALVFLNYAGALLATHAKPVDKKVKTDAK